MCDKEFWNNRYASEDYLYGVEANSFLIEHAKSLMGPVLSLSEGEGRNAIFLALQGLQVHAVDISEVALSKAKTLAQMNKVKIQTEVADLASFEPKKDFYGAVISIFAHLPSQVRARLYPSVEQSLKPGGLIVLEAYSQNQLSRDTGGPKDVDMLMTVDKLKKEFPNCNPILVQEIERDVNEGEGHSGLASVVQFIAQKNT